jgi:gluconolactonase
MISWLFPSRAPSSAKPARDNPIHQHSEMSGRPVMSHLDIRDSRLSHIVEDKPLVKRASGFRFTEGPVWRAHDGVLIFSDIPGDRLYSFEPGSDRVEIFRAPSNKTNGNCVDREGRLVSCEHATSRVVRQEPDGRMTTLASHYAGLELNSPNDIVVDSSGRLYFTDPPYGRHAGEGSLLGVGIPREEQQPVRGVYRLDPRDGAIIRLVEDFEGPNGLCLAEEESVLFVNDTAKMHIRRFAVRQDGVSGGEVWAVLEGDEPGVPDGMKVDAEGNLFCTGPGGVHVFAPNGQILGVIRVPEVTGNFNWGDGDRRTLYICATSSLYSCGTLVPGPAAV